MSTRRHTCAHEGCGNKGGYRGRRCHVHRLDARPCAADGCSVPALGAAAWCSKHLYRAQAGIACDAVSQFEKPVEDRFWEKVEKTDSCWIWTGARQQKGYGHFCVDRFVWKAHRFAYELLVGPIPDGLTIDHVCCNTSCVNPAHMECVSRAENTRRERAKRATLAA